VYRLLTIEEAAEFLNVKPRYVRHLLQRDVIPKIKLGRLVRIDERALVAFIESCSVSTGSEVT